MLITALALFLLGYTQMGQQQSISLPVVVPVHCATANSQPGPTTGDCKIIVGNNTTAILVAKESGSGTITDSLGTTWVRDYCIPNDGGDCIFHAQFNPGPGATGDILTFPRVKDGNGNDTYPDIFIFLYQGTWDFVGGQYGDDNLGISECAPGGACPYNWTRTVEADAGNLIIAYSNTQATGPGLPKPGMGFNIEATDGYLAIEDMLAPTEGVYMGAMTWKAVDGSPNFASCWLMGVGVYSRTR